MQARVAEKLDRHLTRTQYGFRKKRGTADALQYVRRMIVKGEMTRSKTLLVLLDLEKAFDRVLHRKLGEALLRMGIPHKIKQVIQAMYHHPTFCVDMDGQRSEWYKQETGIRQGCPLSPYLFIILMTVMFFDIHEEDKLKMSKHRVKGTTCDEVMYADDTICITESERAMNRLLAAIESEGAKYGMRLNKSKCEYLVFGKAGNVKFCNGQQVEQKPEVKYLGCLLNDKGDPAREMNKRMSECAMICNKLHQFFPGRRLHDKAKTLCL